MTLVQGLGYGVVQGLTEFLPVSSTAHLMLMPWLLRWPDPGLAFDVALHLGTLAAVLGYFWRDWRDMALGAFRPRPGERPLLWMVALGSVPAAAAGLLFEREAETAFRDPLRIAALLAFFGLLLAAADRAGRKSEGLGSIGAAKALLIGLGQALAVMPGVSRSGATITACLLLGLDGQSAARFSFLLSAPIIFGAAALKVPKLGAAILEPAALAAVAAAALGGAAAMHFLLGWCRRSGYWAFAAYRLALAALICAFSIWRP
jgi:undecaprenyl-diphosphatase